MEAMDWRMVSEVERLSEDFIRENKNSVYWRSISASQTLSEEFMLEMKEHVNWRDIAEHQTLSLPFVLGNMEHLDIGFLYKNRKSGFTMEDKQEMKRAYVMYWKDSVQFHKQPNENTYLIDFDHAIYPKTKRFEEVFVSVVIKKTKVKMQFSTFNDMLETVEVMDFNVLFSSLEEMGRFKEVLLHVLEQEGKSVTGKNAIFTMY